MDKEKLIEFAKEQCEIFPEDSEMGKYLRETMKILQAESCEDAPDTNVGSKADGTTKEPTAYRRYRDLLEYFGNDSILEDDEEFKKWLERIKWHVRKANELYQKYERQKEHCEDAVSRQAVDELSKELVHTTRDKADFLCNFWEKLQKLPPVTSTCKKGE